MILTGIYCVALLAALGLLLAACITDFMTMTIPNILPLSLAAVFIIAYGAAFYGGGSPFAPLWVHLLALGVMLGITFLMFAFGLWGAGDSKLAAAIGLWIGFEGIMPFLLIMALAGLGLIGLNFIFARIRFSFCGYSPDSWAASWPQSWPVQAQKGARVLPYGIAIAAGAIASFVALGYFRIQV